MLLMIAATAAVCFAAGYYVAAMDAAGAVSAGLK